MTGGLAYSPAQDTQTDDFPKRNVDIDGSKPSGFDYGVFGARQHIENLHPNNSRGGLRNGVISFAQRVRGQDKRALDAARVFRLAGSENSSADRDRCKVGMVWCHGTPEAPTRHVFSTLADEVLPITHADLISLRAERAKRKAEGKDNTRPAIHLSGATYWESVLSDLQRLRAHRCPEGALPEGQRDSWLFVAGVAISWISPPEVLGREIIALANEAAGWRDSETKSRMSAVIKRARQAADGQKLDFGGREVDCRYRMKANTIVEWLSIDPAEQRAAKLRVLVDGDRKRELSIERTEKSRRAKGVKDRTGQQAARLEMGGTALYMQATKGMRRDDLAAHFGVSAGQISKAMSEARQASQRKGKS